MGRTLSRVAGVVFAGALATLAAAPAALAQTDTSTSPTDTTTSTSETSASSSPASTTAPSSTSVTPVTTSPSTTGEVKTTEKRIAPKAEPEKPVQDEPKDDYQDNAGHGFVGVGGEGLLVISCAAGRPGDVATQYLSVTGGPDQDEADGRLWNYSVRVVDAPAGTTTAKFSWTCGGVEGDGVVEFEQEQPPTSTVPAPESATGTSTSAPESSTASSTTEPSTTEPSTTAPSTTEPGTTAPITTVASSTAPITTTTSSAPAGNAAPKAQVKVAPKGGVETGFGGTAW